MILDTYIISYIIISLHILLYIYIINHTINLLHDWILYIEICIVFVVTLYEYWHMYFYFFQTSTWQLDSDIWYTKNRKQIYNMLLIYYFIVLKKKEKNIIYICFVIILQPSFPGLFVVKVPSHLGILSALCLDRRSNRLEMMCGVGFSSNITSPTWPGHRPSASSNFW